MFRWWQTVPHVRQALKGQGGSSYRAVSRAHSLSIRIAKWLSSLLGYDGGLERLAELLEAGDQRSKFVGWQPPKGRFGRGNGVRRGPQLLKLGH